MDKERRTALPARIEPMLATAGSLPVGPGWAHEAKWDGMRAVVYVAGSASPVLTHRVATPPRASWNSQRCRANSRAAPSSLTANWSRLAPMAYPTSAS